MGKGGVSQTALAVLTGVWLTACDPKTKSFVSASTAEYCEGALKALKSPAAQLLKIGFVRSLAHRKVSKILPGATVHYAARKRCIRAQVAKMHCARLVVLGAGLDGLAYEFAEQLEAVEVDRRDTQEAKRVILKSLPPRPVELLEGDLRNGLPSLPAKANSVVVLEGVLMYLPEADVLSTLKDIHSIADHLIFTFMGLDSLGRPAFGQNQDQIDHYLARVREPFQWGITPTALSDFLQSVGWKLVSVAGTKNTGVDIVVEGMISGEWIAYAIPNIDS